MPDESNPIEVRTRIDPGLMKKLEKLKTFYGITETSEIVRLLITEMYRRVILKEDGMDKVKSEFWQEIRRLEHLLRTRKR